jgi:hypothetical protein
VFLVNSRFPLFSATTPSSDREGHHQQWPPFSRSYGGILPSSLTTVHPNASVFSTRLPVSVSGTGRTCPSLEAFLDSIGSPTSPLRAPHQISGFVHRGFANGTPYILSPGTTIARDGLPSCVTPSLAATHSDHRPTHRRPEGFRQFGGLSIVRLGPCGHTRVREYQPVIHRLRLSASP